MRFRCPTSQCNEVSVSGLPLGVFSKFRMDLAYEHLTPLTKGSNFTEPHIVFADPKPVHFFDLSGARDSKYPLGGSCLCVTCRVT